MKNVLFWITIFLSALSNSEEKTYPQFKNNLCSGFPQIMVGSIENTCLGRVADQEQGFSMPRYSVQSSDGTIYVSDMGSWAFQTGTIWAVELPSEKNQFKTSKITNLFPKNKLTMPNGLLLDPEGRLYVGTPTGVFRFQPKNENKEYNLNPSLELIENGFLSSIFRKDEYSSAASFSEFSRNKASLKNKHPLIQLAANKNFTEIYINVGAPSDDCAKGIKTKNDQGLCAQSESPLVNAGIWKLILSNNTERKKLQTLPMARGLRNSMGLAVHPVTEKLYQAENSMDLKDIDYPFEEINLIEEGRHYGWPYCHSNDKINEAFKTVISADLCFKKYSPPIINMPAHVAPLGLLFYTSDYLSPLKNKLLVSWHGYREYGQKIVSYSLNEKGLPLSQKPENIVFSWAAKSGVRPKGAPVGLTQLKDGRILIIDDKNKALLILDRGNPFTDDQAQEKEIQISEAQIENIKPLQGFLKLKCASCHSPLGVDDSKSLIKNLYQLGMIDKINPNQSKLFLRIQKREMPLGNPLEENTYQDVLNKISLFLKSP